MCNLQTCVDRIICQRNLHKQTQTNTQNLLEMGVKSHGTDCCPSTNNINNNHVVLLLNVVLHVGLWFVSLYVHTKSHVQLVISEGLLASSKYHIYHIMYYVPYLAYNVLCM